MDDRTKNVIVTAGLLIGAVSPVLIVGGKLISGIGTMITLAPKVVTGVKAIGTGAKALWAILSANPIGVVIAVITALVAVFVTLWNKCDGFRNFWIGLWNDVTSKVESAKNKIKNIVDTIKGFFSGR
jgi:phage-related protein